MRHTVANPMSIAILTLVAVFCARTTAFAAQPPRHVGKHGGSAAAKEAAEAREANEKAKKKTAHYVTDEGATGRLSWKEYTANPRATGATTLLVVFGGRDSVRDGRGEVKVPAAIEAAIKHANLLPDSGKLVILVPDMIVEWRRGGNGRETPVADGIPKLVRARAEVHGVKPERIFATGFSMGGGLVYKLLNEDPTLFSRALVVGASGDSEAVSDIKADILAYHGADDENIPIARVKALAEAVNAKKPGRMQVETLKKTGQAESESEAYSKKAAWKWLFSK